MVATEQAIELNSLLNQSCLPLQDPLATYTGVGTQHSRAFRLFIHKHTSTLRHHHAQRSQGAYAPRQHPPKHRLKRQGAAAQYLTCMQHRHWLPSLCSCACTDCVPQASSCAMQPFLAAAIHPGSARLLGPAAFTAAATCLAFAADAGPTATLLNETPWDSIL